MSSVAEHQVVSPPAVDMEDPASTLGGCLAFAQVAEAYRVRPLTVRRWASRGIVGLDGVRRTLPSFKVGRLRYVREADLAAFLEGVNASR